MALLLLPALTLVSLVLLALYKFVIYPVFFHPLRHIPSAHWSIPIFGDTWMYWQRFKDRNNAVTYAAHLKYGSVVRMGENELSVNCVENGIRTIYGGGWEKHAWYPQRFASYGVINMFSTIHHTPHSQKKRTIANVYSKSYIASSPQVAANSVALLSQRFLPLFEHLGKTAEPVDVHDLNNAMAMDFMSAFQYGLSSSTNFTQDLAARKNILYHYHSRREFEFFSAEMPWVRVLTRKLGFPVVPPSVDGANRLLEDWNADMCRSADAYLSKSHDAPSPGDDPIVYRQFKTGLIKLREKDPSAGKPPAEAQVILPTARHNDTEQGAAANDTTTAEIYSEMLDQIGAGHETSAIALTYLYWELSKRPQLQKQLRDELLTLSPPIVWPRPATEANDNAGEFTLPDPKQIDALPLVHAIFMEILRLHTPIPGIEPRISPHTPGGNTLGDYSNIPSGVRVSSMPYTLHRNTDVFPDPETFNPSRWLPSHTSEEQLREMNRWFWAFGSGGRMCIGSHLATQEIKLLVAAIYGNWTTEIVDDEGIEEVDAYTTRPKSNRLILRFVHV